MTEATNELFSTQHILSRRSGLYQSWQSYCPSRHSCHNLCLGFILWLWGIAVYKAEVVFLLQDAAGGKGSLSVDDAEPSNWRFVSLSSQDQWLLVARAESQNKIISISSLLRRRFTHSTFLEFFVHRGAPTCCWLGPTETNDLDGGIFVEKRFFDSCNFDKTLFHGSLRIARSASSLWGGSFGGGRRTFNILRPRRRSCQDGLGQVKIVAAMVRRMLMIVQSTL